MTKQEARVFQKKRISEIKNRIEKEESIRKNLLSFIRGRHLVIGYRADKWEANLDPIWENSNLENEFYFPKVTSKEKREMVFIHPLSWKEGSYGLLEPEGVKMISPEKSDLVLLPALGFNGEGYRLGRGAGYYDRILTGVEPKKIVGIGFSELFSIDFPSTDYDIRVGALVTDLGVLFF